MVDLILAPEPSEKPARPFFSSGPTVHYLGWNPLHLPTFGDNRSHRSAFVSPGNTFSPKLGISETIQRTKDFLCLPKGYIAAILVGGDTLAVESGFLGLLGPRPIDVFCWESFGNGWGKMIRDDLGLSPNIFSAPYGKLPDLSQANPDHDIVFTANGTTSGVKVPHFDWISDDRTGLTICDATSGVFMMDLPWHKLDFTTFSWQKALGGEGGHGVIILSPRAIERLVAEAGRRPWPILKMHKLTKAKKEKDGTMSYSLNEALFEGATINTPSMRCIEDAYDAMGRMQVKGGLPFTIGRTDANYSVIENWVESRKDWVDFLAEDPEARSHSSVCLKFTSPEYQALDDKAKAAFAKNICALLAEKHAAFDINSYRDAPAGLRIWCGPTVETKDLELLMPWIDWAYDQTCVKMGIAPPKRPTQGRAQGLVRGQAL